jgi:2,3-bisphosphoglycerate-independent phosphoglycerate mutase
MITDRRAGRIPSEASFELIELLKKIKVEGVEFFILPVKEHRFAFVMRAPGLSDALSETDPLKVGAPTLAVRALDCASEKAAQYANRFIEQARCLLAGKHPANMITLRGFAKLPCVPTYPELYGLHSAAIAINGMYRGVARLAGMEVLQVCGGTLADEFSTLEEHWQDFDFFYMHIKKTDTFGEAGDFAGKVRVIEEVDALLPRLLALDPDVIVIGGDHSSPAVLKSHSWHPVPLLVYGKSVRADGISEFGEQACLHGSLGVLPAKHVIPIALANAGRITKYGA